MVFAGFFLMVFPGLFFWLLQDWFFGVWGIGSPSWLGFSCVIESPNNYIG